MSSQIVHVRFYCRRRIAVLGERARRRQGESSQAPQNWFDALATDWLLLGFLVCPGFRVFRAQQHVAYIGRAATGVVLAERKTTSQTAGGLLCRDSDVLQIVSCA
jgi:hypothetical protein